MGKRGRERRVSEQTIQKMMHRFVLVLRRYGKMPSCGWYNAPVEIMEHLELFSHEDTHSQIHMMIVYASSKQRSFFQYFSAIRAGTGWKSDSEK